MSNLKHIKFILILIFKNDQLFKAKLNYEYNNILKFYLLIVKNLNELFSFYY